MAASRAHASSWEQLRAEERESGRAEQREESSPSRERSACARRVRLCAHPALISRLGSARIFGACGAAWFLSVPEPASQFLR